MKRWMAAMGVASALIGCVDAPEESEIAQSICAPQQNRMNLVWRRASHNTYEAANTPDSEFGAGSTIASHLGAPTHPATNFNLEIDLRDSVGFTSVSGNWMVAHTASGPLTTKCGAGFKFSDCLDVLKAWHDANPGHPLVTVWLDKKQDWQNFNQNTSSRSPWRLDDLIGQKLGSALFRPADMGGVNLRTNVIACGWPSIDSKAGRFMFIFTTDPGEEADRLRTYVDNRQALANVWVSTSAQSLEQVWTPPGFDNASTAWVAIYNFEWTSPSGVNQDGCDSNACWYLSNAHDYHFLTRAYYITDAGEYNAAHGSSGDGFANFLAVDEAWKPDWAGGFGNYAQ